MENLKSFEKAAFEAIVSGKNWNGKFYEYGKKGTFIFVSNVKYQIVNKDAFLSALTQHAGVGHMITNSSDLRNASRYGFDSIEK